LSGLFIVVGIYLLVPLISAQAVSLKADLPKYIEGSTRMLVETEYKINSIFNHMYEIDFSRTGEAYLSSFASSFFEDLPNVLRKSLTVLLLAPFLAFFMLQDGRRVSRKILSMIPNNYFELVLNLQHQINNQMGSFIRARLFEAAIVGIVVFFGLVLFQFPYASLLALFASLTNLIPYIGPFIGAIPALVIALINGNSNYEIFLISSIYATAYLIDLAFIIPFLVAKIVNLHPVTVILVLIIGAQLMGVLGMIIAIPVASVIKLTTIAFYNHLIDFRV